MSWSERRLRRPHALPPSPGSACRFSLRRQAPFDFHHRPYPLVYRTRLLPWHGRCPSFQPCQVVNHVPGSFCKACTRIGPLGPDISPSRCTSGRFMKDSGLGPACPSGHPDIIGTVTGGRAGSHYRGGGLLSQVPTRQTHPGCPSRQGRRDPDEHRDWVSIDLHSNQSRKDE